MNNFLKIITKFGKTNPDTIIPYINTFQKLQIYNIEYLKGNIIDSFYQSGFTDEQKTIINYMIELNKLGFITIDFTPSICNYSEILSEKMVIENGKYIKIPTNEYLDSEEKAYIFGFIRKNLVEKLDKYITNNPKLKNVILHIPHYYFNKDKEYKKGDVINLGRYRSYKNIADQKKEEWYNESNFFYRDDFSSHHLIDRYENLKYILKDYVTCNIILNEYCTNVNLFEELIKFFRKPFLRSPMLKIKRQVSRKINVKKKPSKRKASRKK
jgi:hypothetical protein